MNYKKIIKDALIGYIGFLLVVSVFQSFFIYHPKTVDSYDIKHLNEIGAISVSENSVEWLYLPAQLKPQNKILIYFHGNAGMAIDRVWKTSFWQRNGFDVVLTEYPSYGTNKGSLSEKSFYKAGRIIINKTKLDFPNADIYIYGESIGSGTAVQMASEYDEIALIIEAGFSSLVDVAFSKMPIIPVKLLLNDKYESVKKINKIDSRLIVIHGQKDNVVPLKFGQKLFDAYNGEKEIHILDSAGHNDIYQKQDMNTWIRELEL